MVCVLRYDGNAENKYLLYKSTEFTTNKDDKKKHGLSWHYKESLIVSGTVPRGFTGVSGNQSKFQGKKLENKQRPFSTYYLCLNSKNTFETCIV
jgi:hypothetical protein